MKKHTFLYFTDNLVAYTSWRMTWQIWCDGIGKDADDYNVTGIEMNTHLGKMYLAKAVIYLTDIEVDFLAEDA